MAQRNVGFVGVGRMGGPMCRRLIEAGNSLTIFDKSDAAMRPLEALGAKRVDSPAAVASAAEIVLASLPTPPIVQAAALGPGGIIEGSQVKIFIDVSTTGCDLRQARGRRSQERRTSSRWTRPSAEAWQARRRARSR